MSNVIALSSHRRKRNPTATEDGCCCHGDHVCYPHRVAAVAKSLREAPSALEGDAWVMRVDVYRLLSDALAELEAITAETLPDERTAR